MRKKQFTGLKTLIKSKGLSINSIYQRMPSNIQEKLSKPAFYNFINGNSLTRSTEVQVWLAKEIDISLEAMLGFYIQVKDRTIRSYIRKPEPDIKPKEIKSSLENMGGDW